MPALPPTQGNVPTERGDGRGNYKRLLNLETLIDGIKKFWSTMTPAVCRKYIDHLHKVMPEVVQVEGAASGY